MISGYNNIINVTHVRQRNKLACVTCTVLNYKEIVKCIDIGQSITTKESFDLKFSDFDAQWILIYYPKGQYDFGVASNNCRVYVKMLSCDKSDQVLRMNIKVALHSSPIILDSHPIKNPSEFIPNVNRKTWAGPFEVDLMKGMQLKDSLTIKCYFEVISNDDNDKFNSKRSISEINYPISSNEPLAVSKKNRSVSPTSESQKTFEEKLLLSGTERANKFKYRVPTGKLHYPFEKEKSKASPEAERKNINEKNSQYDRLSKYKHSDKSRSLIFSPEERAEVMERFKPKLIIRRTTENIVTRFFKDNNSTPLSSRSAPIQSDNIEPKTFKSSQCLKVSDILGSGGVREADKQIECSDKDEMNKPAMNSVRFCNFC